MWLPPPALDEIKKSAYKNQIEALRRRLLTLQQRLREADFPVFLVFAGVDGAGKHETINLLYEWLDPRYLVTLAYAQETDEEAARPRMWRYWRDLPVRGQIGMVLSGWYSRPLLDFVKGRSDEKRFARQLDEITRFERMLVDDGALVLKFWMHLSAEQQRERLRRLMDDPLTVWSAQPRDWQHLHLYQRFVSVSETLLDTTHSGTAPWIVLDGSPPRARQVAVAEHLALALEHRLAEPPPETSLTPGGKTKKRLAKLDLGASLEKSEYRTRLREGQSRLLQLHRIAQQSGQSTVLVFEGWDAAGKGGAIRRLVRPLDARSYRVLPIAAPNDEERARHYLWRFWRHIPANGHLRVFDRSWYGRVLVERVEGFATKTQWQRAYEEIVEFETELVESGIRVMKFWIHISPEEQLARFEERAANPLKKWKLTEEDWRNRDKWADYERAVEDMLAHTHQADAPWVLVAGNDKRHARVAVLEAVCEHLSGH